MALILTFLGKGGTGRTTIAIATAKKLASEGKRVLLAGQDSGPGLGMLLGATLSSEPQQVAANLKAVQLETAPLLEQGWEELKKLEAKYARTPFFKEVYGQELGVLPGMDSATALWALRKYDTSDEYDAIGPSCFSTYCWFIASTSTHGDLDLSAPRSAPNPASVIT